MSVDELLGRIVKSTALGEVSHVPVTLTFGGALISGVIVRYEEFVDGVLETSSEGPASSEDVSTRLLAQAFPEGFDFGQQPAGYGDVDPGDVEFIHLKNAIWMPSDVLRLPLGYWRGRLATVTGWTLGQMNA